MTISESINTDIKKLVQQAESRETLIDIIIAESNNNVAKYDAKTLQCFQDSIAPKNDLNHLIENVVFYTELGIAVVGGFASGFGAGCAFITTAGRLSGTGPGKVFAIDIPDFNIHIKGHDVNLYLLVGASAYGAYYGYEYATNYVADRDLDILKHDVIQCLVGANGLYESE